jgi:hypothetical protein
VELVTCKKVMTSTKQKCTTRLISGVATFRAAAARAVISHGKVVYAVGRLTRVGDQTRLVLELRHSLTRTRYELILRWRSGRVSHLTREMITLR